MTTPFPEPPVILLVDDDADVLAALEGILVPENYRVVGCLNADQALEKLKGQLFAVILADQHMPEMTGIELLGRVRTLQPECSRLLMTGMLQTETLMGAINTGEIYRFLSKPWNRLDLLGAVREAVDRHFLQLENQRLVEKTRVLNLELQSVNFKLRCRLEQLSERESALDLSQDFMRQNFEHSLGLCFRLMSTFYPLLGRQTQAVVEICRAMALSAYFTEKERHALMTSAWIYDLGLVALDRALLHKFLTAPKACTPEENTLLRGHPVQGQTFAAFVDQLQEVGATIRAHHERFDGSGYPDGLAGESIPWTARCLAVAVAFVQCGMAKAEAGEYVQGESGIGFDPEAVRLFFQTSRISELPRNVTEVLLCDLQPGMEMARGVVSPTGMLLVPEGQVLSELTVAKLVNHGRQNLLRDRLMIYA